MVDSSRLKALLEPIRIGDMTLKNRMVMAPMIDNLDSEEGYCTERKKKYLEARARGGAGLIVVGSICVDSRVGRGFKSQLLIDSDKYIPGLRALAHAIQRQGAKACAQIHHFGPGSNPEINHLQNVAASDILVAGRQARGMTSTEVQEVIHRHVEAVVRAKKAGFDSVQIMMSGGYLLHSFLSRVLNKRRDDYGGELRNRARICLDIVKGARERVGSAFPISAKICPSEKGTEYGIEGCFTLEEGKGLARMLEEAGVHFLNVQSRGYMKPADGLDWDTRFSFPDEPGLSISDAAELKKVVRIPLMATGSLPPVFAAQILGEGKIDLMGVARGFLSDPEFANKIASGTIEEITPCIKCLNCLDKLLIGGTVRCTVNPAVGREAEYEIKPADRRKRVLIVGGGPAGMEAARVAALRGHDVILHEKGHRLGGQLLAAAMAPHKGSVKDLADYMERQMRRLGVKVELGRDTTLPDVEAANPDVVIMATGASQSVPEIPGIDGDHVVMARDVLLGEVPVGQRVVVIGGGVVGCETADLLSDKGKKVDLVEMLGDLASGASTLKKKQLLGRLNEKGVGLLTHTRCQEITGRGVVMVSQEGLRNVVEADTVVLAVGASSDTQLSRVLEDKFSEFYLIGDCVEPRRMIDAIDEGFRIGCFL